MKSLLTKITLLIVILSGVKVAFSIDKKIETLSKTNRNIVLADKEKMKEKNLKKLLILGGSFIGAAVTKKVIGGEDIIKTLQALVLPSIIGGLTGAGLKRNKEKAFEGMIVSGTKTAIEIMFFSMLACAVGKKSVDAVLNEAIISNNNTVPITGIVGGAIMSGGLGAATGKVLNNDGLTGGSVTAITSLAQYYFLTYIYKK